MPNKAFLHKKERYPDTKQDDSFLQALAEGGAAMTAYAKMQFTDITMWNKRR